jgi:hypothetical protein
MTITVMSHQLRSRQFKKRPKRTGFELYLVQHRALIETVQAQIIHVKGAGFAVECLKKQMGLSRTQVIYIQSQRK